MTDLLSLSYTELQEFLLSIGEPKYRTEQIFSQMHRGLTPNEMTNLSNKTKEKLSEVSNCYFPKIKRKLVSKIDGTVKYLFEMSDGETVESVVMEYEHGTTICISSQVGCRMGCAFCASTIGGKIRDLKPSEIIGQVICAGKDLEKRIDGIVMMGIGEPLDNYENVIKFLHTVTDSHGLNIGQRHISLSTCGVVDKIEELQKEDLQITLSISLHAYNDEVRSRIMPINKKWNIHELLSACKDYFSATGRRISFEYTLISGENDSEENAKELAKLLNSHLRSKKDTMPIHVNLIPVNPVKERDFKKGSKQSVYKFAETLEKFGVRATVRRTLGEDINASCGQLRREDKLKKEEETK